MPQLFTVRWPHFARLEAVLLFPVAVMAAYAFAPVQTPGGRRLLAIFSPAGSQLGIPEPATAWAAVAIVVLLPYLLLTLVADRFMTVRKGYALLSVVAISAWAWVGMRLSDQLAQSAPDDIVNGINWLSFDQIAAAAIGSVALLAHLWPLWVGLRDSGDVASRLVDAREMRSRQRRHDLAGGQDPYRRQTGDSRDWRKRAEFEHLADAPAGNSGVKLLFAAAGLVVAAGVAIVYHNWDNISATGRDPGKAKVTREAQASRPLPIVNAGNAAPAPAQIIPVAAVAPPPPVSAGATAALPVVQRPGEALPVVQKPSAAGIHEAMAERGRDGAFVFDTVVNGTGIPMVFDTGASVVGIRGEDAARVGIDVTRLTYSAKVKTANGTADVAPVIIDSLTVGSITLRNVQGFVARKGALQMNLLGQSFLARLAGYNVERNQLVLRSQ